MALEMIAGVERTTDSVRGPFRGTLSRGRRLPRQGGLSLVEATIAAALLLLIAAGVLPLFYWGRSGPKKKPKRYLVGFPLLWHFSDAKKQSSTTFLGPVFWHRRGKVTGGGLAPLLWIQNPFAVRARGQDNLQGKRRSR